MAWRRRSKPRLGSSTSTWRCLRAGEGCWGGSWVEPDTPARAPSWPRPTTRFPASPVSRTIRRGCWRSTSRRWAAGDSGRRGRACLRRAARRPALSQPRLEISSRPRSPAPGRRPTHPHSSPLVSTSSSRASARSRRGTGGWRGLAASAVLLGAGYRSTLGACVEQHWSEDPDGYRASFLRLAEDGDEEGWLEAMLGAMATRSEAVARFRRRELSLRQVLADVGVDDEERQSQLLLSFDSGWPAPRSGSAGLRRVACRRAPRGPSSRSPGDRSQGTCRLS